MIRSGTHSSELVHDQRRTTQRQDDAGDLNADRAAVGLLSQEQSLVERTHESPDDHRDAGHDADTTVGTSVLDGQQG